MEIHETMQGDMRTLQQTGIQDHGPIDEQVQHEVQQNPELLVAAELERQKQLRMQAEVETTDKRILSKALSQTSQTFGDSRQMKKVKSGLAKVDDNLNRLGVNAFTDEDYAELRSDYFEAIKSCREYLTEENGSSRRSFERRRLVEKNMNRLIEEAELLGQVRELVRAGRLIADDETEQDFSLREMLIRARIYELGTVRGEKRRAEKHPRASIEDPGLKKVRALLDIPEKKIKDKKKGAAYGRNLVAFRMALKEIPEGKAFTTYAEIAGVQLLISQDEEGFVTLSSGSGCAVLKESVFDLMRMVDNRMIEESIHVPKEDLKELLREQKDYRFVTGTYAFVGEKAAGGIQQAGTRLARFLELRTGKPSTFFSNMTASQLRILSLRLVDGTSPKEIIDIVEKAEKELAIGRTHINTSEILDLVSATRGKETEVDKKVIAAPKQQLLEDGWEDDERATRDLVADLIFSQDTWENDESVTEPGERMRRMLLAHREIIATLIVDSYRDDKSVPSILDRVIDKLPLPVSDDGDAQDTKNDLKASIREQIEMLNQLLDSTIDDSEEMLRDYVPDDVAKLMRQQAQQHIEGVKRDRAVVLLLLENVLKSDIAIKNKKFMGSLSEIEKNIDKTVDDFSQDIQKKITDSVSSVFKSTDENADKHEDEEEYQRRLDEMNPNVKGITLEQKRERIKKGEAELAKILTDSMQGESGQGKFIKIVFENYFKSANILDKRSMFGSAIRGMVPGATDGQFLGGLLKGAGPLFQKMMQGLPAEGMPNEIRTALSDMKSKLAPIPDRIVRAQLLGMVERSNGRITSIEVTRALGAASVGQTFLCRMKGPGLPTEGKNVVVKLLKPDVRNRMMREKEVMLYCARKTDETGGMEATYLGQLSRIEEELDLTIEARNVVKGAIYDKVRKGQEADGVKSMKLNDMVDPTVNSMVLEMAPGTTVDRYIQDLKDEVASIESQMEVREEERAPQLSSRPKYDSSKSPEENQRVLDEYLEMEKAFNDKQRMYKKRIFSLYEQYNKDIVSALKRQKYLTALADKWVSEGIFGEGFYHGDLHAGNIMINDEGLTVIDFGNATILDENQQVQVTRMVGAAAVGDVEGFREGLHKLLKPEFEGQFKRQKSALTREIERVFSLGDRNSAGVRIAVLLLKAQELGLEVPSAIFNFSQCQLRLQNAIDELNSQIEEMKKGLGKFRLGLIGGSTFDNTLYEEALIQTGNNHIEKNTLDMVLLAHYTDGIDHYASAFREAAFDLPADYIDRGQLYEDFKAFDRGDRITLDDDIDSLERDLRGIFDSIKTGKYSRRLSDGMLEGSMFNFIDYMDILSIKSQILAYMDKAAKREDLAKIPTAEDEKWIRHVLSKPGRVSANIKAVLKGCKTYEEHKKAGETDSVLEGDISEIKKAHMAVNILKPMYNNNNRAIQEIILRLKDKLNTENNDRMINEMSRIDEELGAKLKADYETLKKYQKDHPDDILDSTRELEDVLYDSMKLTAIQIAGLHDDMTAMRYERPSTFVDVMGDTILRNLKTSLKRLGFWTSMSYGKKLNAED